jgi:hypothetical protein
MMRFTLQLVQIVDHIAIVALAYPQASAGFHCYLSQLSLLQLLSHYLFLVDGLCDCALNLVPVQAVGCLEQEPTIGACE